MNTYIVEFYGTEQELAGDCLPDFFATREEAEAAAKLWIADAVAHGSWERRYTIRESKPARAAEQAPTPHKLAAAFVRGLREALPRGAWEEMLMRNAEETDSLVCHSNDFCDANMIMAAAFRDVVGHEVDGDNDTDAALWNNAWTIATRDHLTGF